MDFLQILKVKNYYLFNLYKIIFVGMVFLSGYNLFNPNDSYFAIDW
jgi:hypothetical protein